MKKLSLFLSALLISMMSFAQTPVYELVPISGSNNGYAGNCDVEIGGITWNLTGNSTMQPWRIGGKSLTNEDRALYSKTAMPYNISKIEVTHGTASSITVNSFKLIVSDEANGAGTEIDVTFKASATTTIELPAGDYTNKYFKFLYNVTVSGNNNKYIQFTGAKFYAAVSDDMATTPEITGDEHFIASTEVTIQAEDGLKVYYTLDGTEPTNASTEYTAPFTVEETTTVKAIAYDGEKKSYIASATFTKATVVTCAEAAELAMKVASNNALTSVHYVIVGYVTEVIDQALSNGQQRFWIADTRDGGQVLQSYYCNVPQVLKVGDKVQMFGQLTKYNTTPQMKNGEVTLLPADLTGYIGCNNLDFGVVAVNSEVEAKTLTVTAENLTAEITATLDNENFTVTPATLPAAGGDLTITPAADLTAGEHTATLTLTSGDVTKEVALSILVKDVYAIEWYVNGKLYEETTVIEGAALALPEAPEAPEACSEKVFVGWTAAEEVNADGSEIEWATAATVPTTDATYYAVFAVQEGEGGAAEEGTVTLAYTGTTTSNMDLEANNAAAVGLDATKWNVIATKGDNSNAPGLNKSGDIRIYYGDPTSNTITVTSLDETVTISTIVITYTGDSYSNGKILVNDAVVTGTNGTYEINANSFTITNGNTSNVQVRFKNIVINYTAGAAATYTDYSTTCEAEIEWMPMELEITNLTTEVMEVEGVKYLQLMGRDDMNDADIVLFLNNYADVDDDYEVNTESSYMTFGGMEMTVLEGMMTQTSETDKGTIYEGIVRTSAEEEGEIMYVEFALTMYAAPATVLELTDAIVAINEELGTLTFNVPTGEGEGYYAELAGYTAPGVHEGPQICLFETPEIVAYANYVETSVADGVITLKGEFTSFMGPKFDLTISGKLPVVEPEGITYELNGGELPAVVVPTNAELWEAFKPYYNTYYGLARADQPIDKVSTFASAKMQEIMTDEASEYKWLGDYVQSVATAAGVPLSTDMASANEGGWRWAVHAFFNAAAGQYGAAGIDFTEAGKPEAWGAAYEAEYGVVLPTEPVEEDYVLPTPTKTGYDFVGWYDNAEGAGEAMTVLPAGWAGTIYAIWKESATTSVENNIIAEQAVKVIRNGQVLIVIGDKTFNIMGQQVK
jgi:uncharacterized repeat protein (TIGR02543 family)